jgi:hypothetical protein
MENQGILTQSFRSTELHTGALQGTIQPTSFCFLRPANQQFIEGKTQRIELGWDWRYLYTLAMGEVLLVILVLVYLAGTASIVPDIFDNNLLILLIIFFSTFIGTVLVRRIQFLQYLGRQGKLIYGKVRSYQETKQYIYHADGIHDPLYFLQAHLIYDFYTPNGRFARAEEVTSSIDPLPTPGTTVIILYLNDACFRLL